MEDKLGIGLVKELARVIIKTAEELQDALSDGKLQLMEIIKLIDNGKSLLSVYNNRVELVAQLKDIDSEERSELFGYIKTQYNAPNEKVAQVIVLVIEILEKSLEIYEDGVKVVIGKSKELVSLIKEDKVV